MSQSFGLCADSNKLKKIAEQFSAKFHRQHLDPGVADPVDVMADSLSNGTLVPHTILKSPPGIHLPICKFMNIQVARPSSTLKLTAHVHHCTGFIEN